MTKNPITEQLITAQLEFLNQEFSNNETIQNEFVEFYQWFCKQPLKQLWDFPQINDLLQKQILETAASSFLIEQIADHIRLALAHNMNDSTTIEDVIPVATIDKIALYISSKSDHRKALIHRIVNNPTFATTLSQLIQHSIQDYIDKSIINKKVPSVGRFMQMGKSVLETVTDSKLDDTIKYYLEKNIIKISQLSEQVINQQFDDHKLYHFQANLWHKIKQVPLSRLRNYIEVSDLPNTVAMGHEIWDHIRQTDYLKQQLHDGVYAWYIRNQEHNFDAILTDINIDESLIQHELQQLLSPVIQQLISSEQLTKRARFYLEKFYYSEKTQQILNR